MSIRLENVSYKYDENTKEKSYALKNIKLEIKKGEFVGIVGHTGSGKSTLIQHLNGLLKPSGGKVFYNERDIFETGFPLRELRGKVGVCFQYPEYQLFEVTVLDDVCFGPMNFGKTRQEAEEISRRALLDVGIEESIFHKSPFELSGGQRRRAAIAGILAMEPEYFVLDEPTAGLDPRGRDEILGQIACLHQTTGMTVILVSHSMEDIARYADRIIVMDHGEVRYNDAPKKVFAHYLELERMGLAAPQVTYIMHDLRERGLSVTADVTTVEEAAGQIMAALERKR